jgi:hypothetical protein
MFARISNTWALMGASWEVLKRDKELLIFPLISGFCCLLVLTSFALPLFLTEGVFFPVGDQEEQTVEQEVAFYALLFAFYFCNYFVIVFFNAGVVACAVIRMEGGDPTVADGFRAAAARLPQIAGWALVSATVGLILRIIEDKSDKVGKFIAGLLGMAWSVVTFLVVPILVVEKKNPITAVKESTAMLRKTWGEQIVGNFSFGFLFFLLGIPGIALIIGGVVTGTTTGTVVLIGLGVVYLILLGLIQSVLQTIFQAAVYLYAREGRAPEGYRAELLGSAMVER